MTKFSTESTRTAAAILAAGRKRRGEAPEQPARRKTFAEQIGFPPEPAPPPGTTFAQMLRRDTAAAITQSGARRRGEI